jgi:hypothetical protein
VKIFYLLLVGFCSCIIDPGNTLITYCSCEPGQYIAFTSIGVNNCNYPYPEKTIQTINLSFDLACGEKQLIDNKWVSNDIFMKKELICDSLGNLVGNILYKSDTCFTLYEINFERN